MALLLIKELLHELWFGSRHCPRHGLCIWPSPAMFGLYFCAAVKSSRQTAGLANVLLRRGQQHSLANLASENTTGIKLPQKMRRVLYPLECQRDTVLV